MWAGQACLSAFRVQKHVSSTRDFEAILKRAEAASPGVSFEIFMVGDGYVLRIIENKVGEVKRLEI